LGSCPAGGPKVQRFGLNAVVLSIDTALETISGTIGLYLLDRISSVPNVGSHLQVKEIKDKVGSNISTEDTFPSYQRFSTGPLYNLLIKAQYYL
jgi:hypothetical protein